jgi:hypothetical protein
MRSRHIRVPRDDSRQMMTRTPRVCCASVAELTPRRYRGIRNHALDLASPLPLVPLSAAHGCNFLKSSRGGPLCPLASAGPWSARRVGNHRGNHFQA